MLLITNGKIELTRGDTGLLELVIIKDDETEYQIESGDTVKFTVKKDKNDVTPLIQKEVKGSGSITLDPEDTKSLDFGDYIYDVELTLSTGQVITVVKCSRFTVGVEVG